MSNSYRLFFIVALPLLLLQGTWIFIDAKKHNYKFCWLWGLYGVLNIPSSLLIYLLITRVILKKLKK